MKKWRLIGGVALVFVVGALAGAMGFHYYDRQRSERFWKDPVERKARLLDKLTRRLNLSEEQRGQFRVIIDEIDQKIEVMIEENRPRRVIDEGFARMKEGLDPDQRRKLDEMRARHEERMKERRKKPPFL
jgi:uncharacterized membrane protein